ncbi:MAG: PadR family transcriptional regulator [Candidatus Bathyarchaeota archaeon]|nr:PadR family transcriptional regulator [Candidatus Bathyarchaeota archaeon]
MHPHSEDKTTESWLKEAQKGHIRVAVLILLSKKPAHGYEIMKEINNRTKGFWKPTPGGVYPILRNLEKARYIKGEWHTQGNRKIKIYKITQGGSSILKSALVKQNEIANNMNALFEEFAREVLKVETNMGAMPVMPSPFAPFLEDKNQERGNIEFLEQHKKQIKEKISVLRRDLTEVNKQIAELKASKEPK